ncbi:MAG: hypothetical protein JO149_03335 [Gammaproteobacteria bacterium]|nr:hypothetical protein [Gammaproteobacteria bacterium]
MKKPAHGFVIIAILILLQICAWIEILALQNVTHELQQSAVFWRKEIDLTFVNSLLAHIEKYFLIEWPACQVPRMSVGAAVKKPLSWWKSYGCSGNFSEIRYYYAVEWLGKDACAVAKKSNAIQFGAMEYYRITLLAFPESIKRTKILLQSTVAFLSDEIGPCQEKFHFVDPGRQMWREI